MVESKKASGQRCDKGTKQMRSSNNILIHAGFTALKAVLSFVTIVVAAMLLMPLFIRPSCGCRQPSTISNMKQLGLGLYQYGQDYDEHWPARQYTDASAHAVSWRMLLKPYIKNPRILQSLNDRAAEYPDIERDGFKRSFAVNSTSDGTTAMNGPFADNLGGWIPWDTVHNPAEVIGIVESTAAFNDFNSLFPPAFTHPTHANTNTGHLFVGTDRPSRQYVDCVFLDGHAKAVDPDKSVGGPGTNNLWTVDNAPFNPEERAVALGVIDYGKQHSAVDNR